MYRVLYFVLHIASFMVVGLVLSNLMSALTYTGIGHFAPALTESFDRDLPHSAVKHEMVNSIVFEAVCILLLAVLTALSPRKRRWYLASFLFMLIYPALWSYWSITHNETPARIGNKSGHPNDESGHS